MSEPKTTPESPASKTIEMVEVRFLSDKDAGWYPLQVAYDTAAGKRAVQRLLAVEREHYGDEETHLEWRIARYSFVSAISEVFTES